MIVAIYDSAGEELARTVAHKDGVALFTLTRSATVVLWQEVRNFFNGPRRGGMIEQPPTMVINDVFVMNWETIVPRDPVNDLLLAAARVVAPGVELEHHELMELAATWFAERMREPS